MAQQLLTADVLHALKLSKELSVPAAPKEQQGIIGDFVDATQQGAYQGIAGIGEMVGAEGLRDWALEGADAQQATMSDVGREAMAKPIFQEDASGSLELGAGATDARAIALQLGQMIGMNADILAGGGVVKGARMAVTQVAKFARKKMAEKGVPSAFIDDAVNAASTSYLGKLAGKSPEELKSLMTSAADFGVAAHAVSGGLAAIDLREETRAMDFDELENLPEFQTVVRELAETNPQASALDILGAARDALGEQAASAIKTNPALLASNFLVGGLGAATLQRLLKGTIPVGAGIAAEVAAEGTQGAIEQYASNQVRQDLINPDQQLSEGVLSSAANEAAMGGAMGITAAAVPASVSGAKALQQQWQQRQTGQREEQQAAVLPELGGGDELTGFEDPLPTPDAPVKTPAGLSGFYDMASKVSQEHPDFADKVVSLVAEDPKRADAAARVLQRYVQDESFRNTADARLNEFTSGVKPKPVSLAEDVPLSEIYSAQPDEMDDLFGSVEWTPEMDADSAPQVSQSPSPVTNAVLDAAPQNVKDAANFAMESFEANGQYPDDELLRDTFDLAPDQVAEIKKLYAPAQDLSTEAVGNSPDIPPMPSIDVVAHEAATSPFNDLPEPTPAQKEAGNYRKAHLDVQGLKIAIENPKGSVRSGTDAGGKGWSIEMKDHYGYIKRTTGADGDQVDVFIGDEPDSDRVFIVDQYKADGSFDEHKVVLGARTLDQAKATYSRNYAEGWPVGPVKELTMPEFKSWLGQGDTTVPAQPEAVPEGSDLIADFGPLRLEKYSEKSVVIRGDTKANSDLMKSLKGTFNPKLKGGGGWLFPATKADAVKQALSTAKLVAEPKQPTETEMSTLAKGETQTKAQQEAMTLLGAKAGEVIRTMGWGGVFQAGSMFTIEKVKPDGTVAMGVPGQKPSYFSLKDLQKAAKEGVIFEVQKPKQQPELLVSSAQQFEQHKQQLTGFANRVRGFDPEFAQRIERMLPAAPDASYKPGAVFMELQKIKERVELGEKRERLARERKELEAEQLNKPIKGRKITAPAAAAEPAKVDDVRTNNKVADRDASSPAYKPGSLWREDYAKTYDYADYLVTTGQLKKQQLEKESGAKISAPDLVHLIDKTVGNSSYRDIQSADIPNLDAVKVGEPSDLISAIAVLSGKATNQNNVVARQARDVAHRVQNLMFVGFAFEDAVKVVYPSDGIGVSAFIDTVQQLDKQKASKPENAANNVESIDAFIKDKMSAGDLAGWIANKSSDKSYRAIAAEIRPLIPNDIDVMVVSAGPQLRKPIPTQMYGSNGMYWTQNDGAKTLLLKDKTFEENGFNEETVLHELIHAATVNQINVGNLVKTKETDPELARAVQELFLLQNNIASYVRNNESFAAGIKQHYKSALSDVKELVAWGLTNTEFQDLLKSIPIENQSAWVKFSSLVARILGIKQADQNAFNALLKLSGSLLDASKPKEKKASSSLDNAADAISDKKKAAALKLKALIDSRKGQLNSGVDPEVLLAVAEVGALSIAEGAVKFAQWVRDVINTTRAVGLRDEDVKPFLKGAYASMSATPEMYGISDEIADTMDTARDLRKMDIAALLTELEPKNDTESDQENQDGPGKLAQGSEPGAVQLNEDAQGTGAVPGQSDSGVRADSVRELEPDNGLLRDASDAGQGAVGEQRVSAGRKRSPQPSRRKDNGNYRIKSGELKRDGGWKSTAEQNVAIVELVQKITAENRPATPAEKATLVKFTGWGASEIANGVFPDRNGRFKPGWESLGARLKAALSAEQYAEARRTTQYAHYTSEAIINGIYKALGRLGFAGGSVLEPGAGVGHFAGLMPASMAENSQYTGIEYDTTSGTIAKLLYADSNIIVGDYTQTKLPKDFFDVAIGNPPFSSTTVLTDPEYRKQKFMLHDYFFAKTLDRVKPGGLLVFVTSKGTMDKANDRARSYLAKSADLLGAIRLPQTAFKENAGTEVVTDVIFLRKRLASEQSGGAAWLGLAEVSTAQGPALVNEYFAKNPAMVLGTHAKVGSMYRGDEYTVLPIEGDIEALITKAIKKLPQLVFKTERGSVAEAAAVRQRDYDPKIKKEGGIYVADDGTLMQVEDGQGVALTQRVGSTGKLIDLKPAEKEWLKGYTVVRDALKQAQYDQLNEGDWQTSLNALNQAYTGFVKKHGELQAYTASEKENDDGTVTVTRRFKNEILYRLDAEGALVHALEYVASDGKIEKGPALKDRTLNKPAVVTITSTQDAMFVSLNERGSFDLPAIAKLAGKTEAEVISDLGDAIYQAPEGGWTTADDYLSGNVVRKLKEAKAAVRLNKAFERNVKALEQVQPRQLTPQDITVQLGSHWVPASDVQSFAAEALGEKMKVTFSPLVNQWSVEGSVSRVSEWGIPGKSPDEILSAVLNNRQIKMTSKDAEGKTYTLIEPTEKANDIAKKMKAEFKRWIWTDSNRSHRLVSYYNEHFNNIAPRSFDGQHLTLPGISSRFSMRPHQKRGVWRTIQQGNTYYAHSVGAGKTFTMIAAGMEERRLGLVKKPMYVVPNHMLAQFSKEFLELYPTAQIMVADEQNFHTHNRRKFVAQAALNDPDAIVITHSAFGRIGMSPEFSAGFIRKQIDEWNEVLDEADQSDRLTVKQIEARIEKLENRLEALTSKEKKDQVLTFEELGVDRLYIDEGHEFRKLDFPTNRTGIKGIDPSGSQKAMDLYMKLEYLKGVNPGRSLVMASGTPVTNTMGELFSIQRYFQGDQLEEDGLASFDGWSNHFGEVVEGLEQNAAGGYEAVSRFAKFVNVPELMSRVRSFMDVLTSQQLGDLVQRPDVIGGGRKIKVTPVPDGYKAYQKTLEERILAIRNRKGPPKPGDDIILSVISDGRFSAIDMRFVDPTLPSDPNSKLNLVIADMVQAYHATATNQYATNGKVDPDNGGTLMLFTDIGLGEQSAASRGFHMKAWIERQLIAGGVKPEHIAFMRDHKAHAKKEKLFNDLRQGKKRILIGGKDMETGVNAQKRLTHLFHLDAPWFPASVEQREGRIIRQGNQNKEVNITAFATKGSYDSTMWGMNARKARFIEQAMSGDSAVRNMDDVSESSAFEMAAALASGDERYLKLAGLKGDIERLSRLYSAHLNDQRRLGSEKQSTENMIRLNTSTAEKISAAIKVRTEIKPGSFTAMVGRKSFDNREDFSAAVFDAFKALAESYTDAVKVVGSIGGFDIKYHGVILNGGNFVAELSVDVPTEPEPLAVFPIDPEMSVNGIATRAVNQVNGLDRQLDKAKDYIQQYKTTLEKIQRRLGASFAEEAELNEKQEALEALEKELAAESKEAESPAAAVDADSVVDIPAAFRNGVGSNAVSGTPAHSQVGNGVELRIAKAVALAFDNSLMNPGAGTLVVNKFEDFPEDIQSLASPDAAAFYYQDKVYVNLQHIRDKADLQEVLVHERLRHGGLRLLLGRELWNELNRLATLIGPTKLRVLADKYNVNVAGYMKAYAEKEHPFPEAALLDEVMAHIKEGDLPKGLWAMLHRWAAKVVNTMRNVWGMKALADKLNTPEHEMLFDLVRRAKAKVVEDTPLAVKQKDFDAPMMLPKTGNAIADAVSQINADRLGRMAQLFKPAKIWQAMKVKWPDLRPAMLQLIPRNYLADIAGDLLPSLRRYNNQVASMEADRNHLLGITHETADKWRKLNGKNTKASIALADLMHEATLIGVDPSTSVFKPSITPQTYKVLIARAKEFIKARNGEAVAVARGMERMKRIKAAMDKVPEQDAAWHQLRQSYLALPAEYQQLFNEVRDSYKEMNDKRVEVLQKRIEDLIADKRVAAAQIRMMQEEFEVNELSGIYFPLQRFGKYRAAVKDTATNELIAFSMFDSNAEMQEWIRAKSAPGLSVVGGYEYEFSKLVDGVSMGFMKDLLDKFGMTFNRNNKIQDDLYQLFLEHNPSLSMRKHMIHRKGVAGFDQDALRAYAHNMFHSAYQISKTAHTHHMQAHILAMEEEANTITSTDDRVRGIQVVNELNQRNEWILNPKGSEWAQKLTGFGFFWYLGTTPAAALVNVTQTAMVGLPILGARYSYKAAGQALYDVSKAFMKGRGHVDKTLAGHELAAFRELERSGIIDKTMAHDMTGIADGGVAYSPRYHQVMKVSGFLFHHAERFNREVTAMASYRLAYAKKIGLYGASAGLRAHKEAIQEAMDLTRLSHFDYANSNRPRFMQGDMARVLLLFRQHSVNMTYRLLRDFQQSFWGEGKDKAIARKQLAGMLGMTFLFAGAAGLPLYSLIAGIFNTLGGDEDEPFNFDESVRELLAEALGETAASMVMSGVPGTMTGADLTNRIGMNNLWFRDADASLEGEAAVGYYAEQALGPMYGILTGWGRAVEFAREGHSGKAWEAATPKFARDWFKAVRYATDGVQTKRGDPILDEVSPWQIALQANGFSPLEVSEQYQKNNALSSKVRAIRDRRQLLLNRWALGKRLGDYELEYEALEAIERFNQANPTVAIRSSDRVRSMKQRERISQQAVNGVIIPKKLNELVN